MSSLILRNLLYATGLLAAALNAVGQAHPSGATILHLTGTTSSVSGDVQKANADIATSAAGQVSQALQSKTIPAQDACAIIHAFMMVESSRKQLQGALSQYISAANQGFLARSEAQLTVIETAHRLTSALSDLAQQTSRFRLVLPAQVKDTETYSSAQANPSANSVTALQAGQEQWSFPVDEARQLLGRLEQNTPNFDRAYQGFGDAILQSYGASLLTTAGRAQCSKLPGTG